MKYKLYNNRGEDFIIDLDTLTYHREDEEYETWELIKINDK